MARIPNNMTEMLYIIGHGNEYIDTGIHLDNDCLVKSRWSFNGTAACIYGCFTSSAHTDNFCLYGGSSGADAYIRFNGQLVRSFRPTSYTIYNFEHSVDGFFVNGTRHATFSAATFTCSASLRIFGLPNSHYDPIAGRCYGFQIFKKRSVPGLPEETNLIYNFVPVKNNDTGEVGMYETINGKFYGNDGSGSFAASPDVVTRPIAGKLSYFRRRLMRSAVEIEDYIVFADPIVEQICVTNWGDGTGLKPSQAARVTNIGTVFKGNTGITSFDELQYFVGLTCITGGTAAAAGAFRGCTSLVNITIPSGVTDIQANSFNGCTSLASLGSLANIRTIDANAFGSCTALAINLNLPNLTSLGMGAFYNTGIVKISSLGSITTIAGSTNRVQGTFRECTSLTEVSLPNTIQTLQTNCFYGCSNLETINLPASITTIGASVFYGTKINGVINLPNLTSIGDAAFHTTKITEVVSLGNITTLPGGTGAANGVFRRCYYLTEVNLPNTITSIGQRVFNECSALVSIKLGTSLTTINNYALAQCASLTTVDTENTSLATVAADAFYRSNKLLNVILPSTISNISTEAFQTNNNPNVDKVYVIKATTPPTLSGNNIFHNYSGSYTLAKVKIYVPYSSDHSIIAAYQSAWSTYSSCLNELDEDGNIPA